VTKKVGHFLRKSFQFLNKNKLQQTVQLISILPWQNTKAMRSSQMPVEKRRKTDFSNRISFD